MLIIVLVIASCLQMYFNFRAQQKLLSEYEHAIARDAANSVTGFIREKFNLLDAVSRRSNIVIMPVEEQKPLLEKLLGLEPAFRQLFLLNLQGDELLNVSRLSKLLSKELMEYDSHELLAYVRQNEKYTSSIYIDKVTNEPMMIMAVPITDVFKDMTGILIAETNLKFMWDLVSEMKIGKNGLAYVIDKQGNLIAFRDISRVLKRENLNHLNEVHNFSAEHIPIAENHVHISKGILNTTVLTTHIALDLPQWTVIIELPIIESYETVGTALILSALVIFISILAAIVFGSVISKRMIQPIVELRDATEKIGSGQLDLKTNIHSKNEIGELAASFNKMVDDLKRTTVTRDALMKEVNERKQIEKILKESEQKMKAILMASPIGIGLIINDRIEWANDSLFRMTGYENNSLLGQNTSILYSSDKEYERVSHDLYQNTTISDNGHIETQWIRNDGDIFDCILGACSLDPVDPSKGQIVTIVDISEMKRLQAKLLQAQKMEAIGTLAAGIAHDLNNILVGIVGYPEYLLLDMPVDDPLREPLQSIQTSGEKAATIVQDLLTLARRGVTNTEIVNLNTIISDYLKSPEYENLCSFHSRVRIITDLDSELLNIAGSPFHLSKTIMNLVSNAAESIRNEGEILISTQNQYLDMPVSGYDYVNKGEYVTLKITDSGEGISKDDMKKIFEPFYTKKKMGRSGTGLGMAVVWGTVKDHNGYIDLHSIEGKGTTFKLYFPASRKDIIRENTTLSIA
ncbi:HAMP domain-containing protein [candidate division KSB1 bacterium]|nr:HAMP domain-containing protein [candidate division KSB1 bacterium]